MLSAGDCAHTGPTTVNTMPRQATARGIRPHRNIVAICVLLQAGIIEKHEAIATVIIPRFLAARDSGSRTFPVDHDGLRVGGFVHTLLRPPKR
jgi:hypothetical protein